jgi:hypothetical protein
MEKPMDVHPTLYILILNLTKLSCLLGFEYSFSTKPEDLLAIGKNPAMEITSTG